MNLENIGIKPNLKYECIYTTISEDGIKDIAPIGFTYLGNSKVTCTIFEGSTTLKNIQETKQYVVNITENPLTFVNATLNNMPQDCYSEDENIAILKDAEAYLIIDVCDIKEKNPSQYPIKNSKTIFEVTGNIKELVVNDENVKAFNRGMGCLIDSLVNYTRYDIVDDETKEFFDKRLEENQRIINKVADNKTIEAIELIKKNQVK